jgi:cbb3-type cytochrome oxidase maturation protein
MEVTIFLVPMALPLDLLGLAGFLWSLKSGQFDDLDGAAWRAIIDPTSHPDRREGTNNRHQARRGTIDAGCC